MSFLRIKFRWTFGKHFAVKILKKEIGKNHNKIKLKANNTEQHFRVSSPTYTYIYEATLLDITL